MECKHDWKMVPAASSGQFRDECSNCGCVGEVDWKNPVNGFYQIKARPLAKVLDFAEFKKRREVKLKEVANG